MIAAILHAQWLSMRTFRMRTKPAATIFSNITGVLFYGFWLLMAFGIDLFLANPGNRSLFSSVVPLALFVMFLYWQGTPLITASMGSSLNLQKLLIYPIPIEQLFLVEVLLRVATCAEMIILLAGAMAGIFSNPELGGYSAIPRLVFAGGLFVLFNLLVSAGLRNLLERLLKRRRMREVMTLLLVAASVAPQFLLRSNMNTDRLEHLMPVSLFFPWNATAGILLGEGMAQALPVLALFVAAAYFFGRWQFNVSLRFDGESNQVRPRELQGAKSRLAAFLCFPARFLPDPMAAIVEKEVLSLSRMAPFRLVFVMGSSLGVILWLPQMMGGRPGHGFISENLLTVAAAYGILVLGQVSYANAFGFERSAVQTWFSIPVSMAQVIRAKNIASGWLIALQVLLTTAVCIACRIPLTPAKLGESFLVAAIVALYLVSFGNIVSIRLPRPMNPEKVNQGGASKMLNALTMFCFPLVLAPIGIAFWARSVFRSNLIFFLLLALATVIGGVVYWIALDSAAIAASDRREKILSALLRNDGPISIS